MRKLIYEMKQIFFFFFIVVSALQLPHAVFAQNISGFVRIIDADTIEINQYKIRLHGIDAPEMRQFCENANGNKYPCGLFAKAYLENLINGDPVTCLAKTVDRYGRSIGVCQVRGEDINLTIVLQGWAIAYRQYSTDYVSAENDAKLAKRGIWVGRFIAPWQWRRGGHL